MLVLQYQDESMNYFDIYIGGLALMDARMRAGKAINEGLLYPISMTAIEIEEGISLKDLLFSFYPR